MQHPDEGTVHAWLDDALPADEAQALETHVASCAECATMVAEARGLIASASRIVRQLDGVPAKVIPIASANRAPTTRSWTRYSGLAAATLFVASTATWLAVRDKGAIGVTLPSVAMESAAKTAPEASDSMASAPSAVAAAASVVQARASAPARENVARAAKSLADRRSEAVAAPMATALAGSVETTTAAAPTAPLATAPAIIAPALAAPAIAERMATRRSVETANDVPVSLAGCYRLTPIAATGNGVATTLRLTDSLTPSDAAKRSTSAPVDRLASTYLGYATGLGPVTALAERGQASEKVNGAAIGAAVGGATRAARTRSTMASAQAASPAPALVLNTNAMIRWSPAGDGLVRLQLADESSLLIRLTADATARAADISRDRDATRAASAAAVQFTATRVSCPQ